MYSLKFEVFFAKDIILCRTTLFGSRIKDDPILADFLFECCVFFGYWKNRKLSKR